MILKRGSNKEWNFSAMVNGGVLIVVDTIKSTYVLILSGKNQN